jgi:DNA/RNA-binding domain of Phe-tRNA-synthetase-like protein
MYFHHSKEIWQDYPWLSAGVLHADGITANASFDKQIAEFHAVADTRLAQQPEGQFPEIQAWRRTFTAMGLKSTQYRCAAESLLRRYRKDGSLPAIHPLVDLCNAVSLAYAVPIAVFDIAQVADSLQVRYATGDETYLTFSGVVETPEAGEVVFVDAARRAHARRWTNRQSAYSSVSPATASVLIVAEAMHDGAGAAVLELLAALADALGAGAQANLTSASLTASAPRFSF